MHVLVFCDTKKPPVRLNNSHVCYGLIDKRIDCMGSGFLLLFVCLLLFFVLVNMVFNVHRNHAYLGRGEWGKGGVEVGEEGVYIPIATLSPPE